MLRTIDIKGRTGRIDVPSFLLTDSENLILKFKTSENRIGRYVVSIKLNESKRVEYLGKDMCVIIPAEWLNSAGIGSLEIFLEFRTYDGTKILIPSAKDTETGGFFIEPLLIEKMDDSFTAKGWLSAIEERQNRLEEAMKQIGERLAEFEDNGVPLVFEEENEIENE